MSSPIDPQLLADLQAARSAAQTPAWVRALLGVVVVLVQSLSEQIQAMMAQLQSLQEQLREQQEQNGLLRKQLFDKRSERSKRTPKPPPEPSAKPKPPARRGASALDTAKLPEQVVDHPVPPEQQCCPQCGGNEFVELPPDISREFELRVAQLIRRLHRRQKLACRCGGHIVTAPAPLRVTEGGLFGPALHADTVVRRCMDAIPLNRMADMYQRQGIPLGVSTLNDLFHAVATKVDPLYDAMERCLLSAAVIHADETPQRVLAPGKCETGYLWSFSSDRIVLHIHAKNRSGSTPRELLEGTQGVLVADAYSGYNVIEGPNSRLRQGCMAHVRRKFVEALATDPERARLVLRWIACLYQVESHARELYVEDPQGWQRLRDERSRPIMANLLEWLDENKPQVRPKSPIGRAIGYMISQWSRLCVYLDDPAVPIDNNEAERQLRRPVLGRKTSLFVANHDSGQRYAVNSSVVMTCRKVGVNPTEYLKWLLTVIDDYPARAIDDLLPHNYAETRARMDSALDKTG